MKPLATPLVALLALFALPALAGHPAYYDRGHGRELVQASRHLNDVAGHLHYALRERQRRSEAAARARDLVEATRDFERLVERDAPPRRLHEAYHRVEKRKYRLERELHDGRWLHPRSGLAAGLRQLDRATAHAGRALERRYYAWDGRRDRPYGWPGDRHEPWPYR